ncbi:MAG: nucleotidyl transferase AbiEii/AbiGii toxin family protein [Nitrospinae bacterium]|nr:nucleotidyl transferase AbiEii/AbiGii toxin family protein [Nitrospinota bacterium]
MLTSLQVRVLEKIYKADRYSGIAKDFFLTGGTALSAFYLHHRESIDLDFFSMTDKPFHSHRYLVNVMEQLSEI